MNDSTPVLHAQTLVKAYEEGNNELEVLKGVDLTVHKGDILAIIGASGSGKSTLLNLLGGLDHATRGSVSIAGTSVASLNDRETGRLRNRYLGFVYQFHHLLPEFTALENVAMPLLIRGEKPADCQARAAAILAEKNSYSRGNSSAVRQDGKQKDKGKDKPKGGKKKKGKDKNPSGDATDNGTTPPRIENLKPVIDKSEDLFPVPGPSFVYGRKAWVDIVL